VNSIPLLLVIYACIQMGFGLGSAAAFLFVIWPHIREQARLGKKISDLLDFYNRFNKEL